VFPLDSHPRVLVEAVERLSCPYHLTFGGSFDQAILLSQNWTPNQ
jgi:hypothetical protein